MFARQCLRRARGVFSGSAAGPAVVVAAAPRMVLAARQQQRRWMSEVAEDGPGWMPETPIGNTPVEELEGVEWSPTGYVALLLMCHITASCWRVAGFH